PDDVQPLDALIDRGEVDPATISAIITKTEGNGRVNDYTRPFAAHAFSLALGRRLRVDPGEVSHRVALVVAGGCEGVVTPRSGVRTRREVTTAAAPTPRLAIGVGFTRVMQPEEVGSMVQVELVAEATRAAAKDAGLALGEVKFVQTKGPLLT